MTCQDSIPLLHTHLVDVLIHINTFSPSRTLEKVIKYWPTSIVEELFANTDGRYTQKVFISRLHEKTLDDEWVKVIITQVEKMYISTKAEVIQQKLSHLRLWWSLKAVSAKETGMPDMKTKKVEDIE